MARGGDNDVKDQELQIKIQENERLQREVSHTKTSIVCLTVLQESSFDDFLQKCFRQVLTIQLWSHLRNYLRRNPGGGHC